MMLIFNLAIGVYLLVGSVVAGLFLWYVNDMERELTCNNPQHRKEAEEITLHLKMLGTKAAHPKLMLVLTAILFWPWAVSNIKK